MEKTGQDSYEFRDDEGRQPPWLPLVPETSGLLFGLPGPDGIRRGSAERITDEPGRSKPLTSLTT